MIAMMNEQRDCPENRLEVATSHRLARLAGRPVDTASLERRLASAIEEPPASASPPVWLLRWSRPAQAAAAVVLLVLVGWMLTQQESSAIAAPAELAQIHRQMIAGDLETTPVMSIEAANAAISGQWESAPAIPQAPGAQVMACSLHLVQGARLAVVRLEYNDAVVKLAVAHARDIQSPGGRQVERGGQRFVLHEHEGVTMAMTRHGDRWLCVMGELPEQKLLELAGGIVF